MLRASGERVRLKLEAPAGLIEIEAHLETGQVTAVSFQNQPAVAVHLDAGVEVPQLGTVTVDVAYGGMFYVIIDADQFGLKLSPDEARDIVRTGEMVKAAAREQLPAVHPENPAIAGITIAQLSARPSGKADLRNAVVVSTGEFDWNRSSSWTGTLDRSPCGTGTCAKMAVLHAKGLLPLNQDFIHEGILGTTFTGRLISETRTGPYNSVIPTITGRAWITGFAHYVLAEDDPFPTGFVVGDLWAAAH
jgi:proline racemase